MENDAVDLEYIMIGSAIMEIAILLIESMGFTILEQTDQERPYDGRSQ